MQLKPITAIIVLSLVVASLLVSGCITTPAYEFKTGVNSPQEINDLIKHGITVFLISQDGCLPVESVNSTFADLQKQYPDVTFASLNLDHNTTAKNMSRSFDVHHVPAIFVIRGDGTAAKFQPSDKALGGTMQGVDISTVKSAIENAQNWQHSHPTPNP